jgi:Kdo2-lipid IVA lauroyltransferase/acyltransferase
VRLLLALLRWTPRPLAMAIARLGTALLDRMAPRLRRIGRVNLAFAFPEKRPAEREAILDEVFRSIARMLVVFARFPSLDLNEWIRYDGLEHFHAAKQAGHGALFYTAHLGNWELSAFAHGRLTEPMAVVVRPLDNPLLDALARRYRTLGGNQVIEKKEARPLLRMLQANRAVGILADQNAAPEEGVFVRFFGKLACAHTGFARLARHTGATVIPGYALWEDKEQRYVLRFFPPVAMTGDEAEDTQRLHTHLESVIRAYPGQWLWIHRRWKTRPSGEPPLY